MKPYALNTPPRDTAPDLTDAAQLQKQLAEDTDKLLAMADEVGLARHVLEYDSDRRKRILAVAAAPLIAAGSSSAGADTEARSSPTYQKAMELLGKQHAEAEKSVANWDALRIKVEAVRSLLSMEKTKAGLL
jgi:hypothetical protein